MKQARRRSNLGCRAYPTRYCINFHMVTVTRQLPNACEPPHPTTWTDSTFFAQEVARVNNYLSVVENTLRDLTEFRRNRDAPKMSGCQIARLCQISKLNVALNSLFQSDTEFLCGGTETFWFLRHCAIAQSFARLANLSCFVFMGH
jgi:hypothetical protein